METTISYEIQKEYLTGPAAQIEWKWVPVTQRATLQAARVELDECRTDQDKAPSRFVRGFRLVKVTRMTEVVDETSNA